MIDKQEERLLARIRFELARYRAAIASASLLCSASPQEYYKRRAERALASCAGYARRINTLTYKLDRYRKYHKKK